MKKVWWFIALLILISACQTSQSGQTPSGVNYRTGTQGIIMTFLPDQPPARIYDTEDLNVLMEVKNSGAADVGGPGDRIYFGGFDPRIITNVPPGGFIIPKIEGRRGPALPAPDFVNARGIINPLAIERFPFTLSATACYDYETVAEAPICVDPDPYEFISERKVCKPQNIGLGSQGAPIVVSGVEVESRKNSMTLTFSVRNSGGGQVFRFGTGYLNKCSPYVRPGLMPDEVDYVMVQDVTVGGVSLKPNCRPLDKDHLRLTQSGGTLVCNMDTNNFSPGAVSTSLKITLKYGYRNVLFKNVEVVKTPR